MEEDWHIGNHAMPSPLRRTLNAITRLFSSRDNECSANNQAYAHWHRSHFIQRLPIELVAQIFVLGAEEDVMLPVVVSHVCRSWRAISMHTPRLWRRISLSLHKSMWRERIRRAKACSLDVQLLPWRFDRDGAQLLDAYTVQMCMHLVLPFVHRWRTLEIVFLAYAPFLMNAALSECCTGYRAQMLEELTLVYRANDDTTEYFMFSGHAPRLRRLTLDGLRLTWLPSLFGNLTFLDYTHHGFSAGDEAVSEVLCMLAVCTALHELKIFFPRKHLASPPRPFRVNKSRVTLPWLIRLHLRVETPDIPLELTRLVTHLSTPSLTCLYLVDIGHRRYPFPSLMHFMRTYPKLPRLEIVFLEYGWQGSFRRRRRSDGPKLPSRLSK